jgi:hypothetical protein
MKRLVPVCLCIPWLLANAYSQVASPAPSSVRSRSGQFIVYGCGQSSTPPSTKSLSANSSLVRLEPTLLTISCERIKQALLWRLGATDQWRGKVYLLLHPAQNPDEIILVTSSKFADGWAYRVELPDALEPERLVRALVRVLLVEWANRNAAERSVEIPLWLSEGLSEEMLATSAIDLVLQPPEAAAAGLPLRRTMREERRANPLARASEQLRTRSPLTLEELSWPEEEQLTGDAAEAYRSSAQLFVHELLRLKDGRACLCTMLGELAQYLNWQTAFLHTFGAHFERQLDLEKWWALQVVHFTGHQLAQNRSGEDSLRRLDDALRTPVQVPVPSDAPPQHAEVRLQTVIQEWDYARQRQVLQTKIQQLQMLRLRVAQPVLMLADNYLQVLQSYLRRTEKWRFATAANTARPAVRRMIEQTVKQLDALDARREMLWRSPPAAGQASPNPADSR